MVQEQKDLGIHEHDHIMGMLKKKKKRGSHPRQLTNTPLVYSLYLRVNVQETGRTDLPVDAGSICCVGTQVLTGCISHLQLSVGITSGSHEWNPVITWRGPMLDFGLHK